MTFRKLRIVTPSRLHFGLLNFGHDPAARFGGVGLMIERPGIELCISPAEQLTTTGPLADRVRVLVRRWCNWQRLAWPLACRIDVVSAPELHIGLGVGTQLGLAVARGLETFLRRPAAELSELAQSVGRGERSAVGTLGFQHGGLIVELGKSAHEPLSKLRNRVQLPDDWRVVLIRLPGQGLHGARERSAFAELPEIPPAVTRQLTEELTECLLPAAAEGQFDRFSESVYQYGRTSGMCFAPVQGGAYNGTQTSRLVTAIRRHGVRGVGQSSWGPSVYAMARDRTAAEQLVERLQRDGLLDQARVTISRPSSSGARCEWA